jgi:hypothetical protein
MRFFFPNCCAPHKISRGAALLCGIFLQTTCGERMIVTLQAAATPTHTVIHYYNTTIEQSQVFAKPQQIN